MADKNILILGGSYGGVSTAHYLLKHVVPQMPNKHSYRVIVVSAASQALCRPACCRALISDEFFSQERLFVSIPQQFEQYPIDSFRFLQGTASELDHKGRSVTVTLPNGSSEKLDFFALVIATGASTPSPLLGLNKDEDSLRASWAEFRKALPTAKSIIIAGGGPAGIETAGELGDYLNGSAGMFKSKQDSPKVPITVVTSDSKILPGLRGSIADRAERYLAKQGVTVIKNSFVKSVSPEGAGTATVAGPVTVTLQNGKTMESDLYIPAYGLRPNTSFVDKNLLKPNGAVDTNTSTLRVDKAGPRIYAVGDASSYARPAIHQLLEAIPVLCANIKRDLLLQAGKEGAQAGQDREFKEDTRETQLVAIGRSKGVGAMMGYQAPSLAVWGIKGRDYWLWTTGPLWSGKQWAKEK